MSLYNDLNEILTPYAEKINSFNTSYATLATSKRTVIPDGTDIDTLTVGNYKIGTVTKANTMVNLPTSRPCIVLVLSMGASDSLCQFCLSSSPTKPNIFYRQKNSNSDPYTEWVKLYDTDRDAEIDSAIETNNDHLDDIDEQLNSFNTSYVTLATSKRTIIPDGTDINTLTVGNYKIGTVAKANTMVNLPTSRPCIVLVLSMGTADSLCQFCLSSSPTKPNIFYRQKNSNSDPYTEWVKLYDIERDKEIENKIEDTKNFDCGYPLSVTQIPSYRIIKTLVPTFEWTDNVVYDGRTYNQTQGICSDGKRYLYYPLRAGTVAYGDSNIMLIRKWDTYYNKPAGLHISTIPYGHGEDIEYIPSWVSGFDNGNVNRLYVIDMERYATGLTIHVVNADTLEYITSFQTAELPPYGLTEYWRGANHVMFNAQRGEIVLNSIHTDDNNVHRCILAIYDKDGNYERGVLFTRTSGTQLGCFCDENYIYMTRYVMLDGISHQYIYMLDWNLNPVRRVEIERTHWEWEGICAIGQDIYTSWIVDGTSKGVAIIKNNVLIKDCPYSMTFPDDTWLSTDGFRLNSFTPIPPAESS